MMAMHMGVRIDADNHSFSRMTSSDIESRRRLWATILELEVQSSMDCGGLPSIDGDDYDCALLSNIDDASLEAGRPAGSTLASKPMDQFTQFSIQILLMKTIPVRLKIAKFVNNFRAENSFEMALISSA
jgi:hypothetical protein